MTDLEKDKILLLAHSIGKMARELQSTKRLLKEIADTPQTDCEDVWRAGYKTGYDKGFRDAQKVNDSQELVKDLIKAFCENGTWLERQGVYTLTLAEAKQRAIDIIESVLAKDENSSEIPNNCEDEPRKEQNFCGKCRYLYRDFKYGLSCYRLMDNEPCKYEERKDEPTTQTETQNSNLTFKTLEYCDICDHKGCEECIANAIDEHCMPSQFNKQIEDECTKEYEELGLKELKELIEADRKTEPTISKMEQVDKDINVRSKDEPQTCSFSDCDNFKNPDYERCIECKRKQIKLKTEQTERSE